MKEQQDVKKKDSIKFSAPARLLAIALAILFVISILLWGSVSCWGNIKVSQLDLVGAEGLDYSAVIYTPKTATNATPAPAILIVHGNSGNARNHEAWAIEFARRGIIALCVEYAGGGDGTAAYVAAPEGMIEETPFGPQPVTKIERGSDYDVVDTYMQYLVSMPIVDAERVMISGHSRGAQVAADYGVQYDVAAMLLCSGGGAANTFAKTPYDGNLLLTYGTCERNNDLAKIQAFYEKVAKFNGVETNGALVVGTTYGSFEQGNANRYLIVDGQLHETALSDRNSVTALMDFAQSAVTVPNYIEGTNQVWQWRDVTGLVGMLAFVFFLLALAVYLMKTIPWFADIEQPMPRNIGLRGPGLIISIVAAVAFPLLCVYTGSFGLTKLLGTENYPLFAMGQANNAFTLVVGIMLCGIVMLVLYFFTEARKNKATLADFGVTKNGEKKLSWSLIGKCLLLSVCVIAIGFAYLGLQREVFGTEFYTMFFGYRPIPLNKFWGYLPYIVIFMLCFVVSALGMNVERRLPSTGNDKKDFIIAMVVNTLLSTLAISAIVIVQFAIQKYVIPGGTRALSDWGVDITRIWGMPVGMLVAGAGSTYLYRKSGSIWLGAFLMGILCALGCVLYGQYHMFLL